MTTTRLDKFLTEKAFYSSREKAREAIRHGLVKVNGNVTTKPSFSVSSEDQITIIKSGNTYVSKGGYKLEKAIREFGIDFNGKTVLDAGASTGGFTDCALQHGAVLVVAVDVGTNQLAATLRKNEKVISLENTDIRSLSADQLPQPDFDVVVADLSFISLEKVIDDLFRFRKPGGEMIVLVKPQFEQQERKNLKNGIVKDESMRKAVLERIIRNIGSKRNSSIAYVETDVEDALLKNIEYLLAIRTDQQLLNHD